MNQKVIVELQVHNAQKAIEFYQKVLKVKVKQLMKGSEMPQEETPSEVWELWKDKIIHCELTYQDNLIFIADLVHMNPDMQHSKEEDCHNVVYTVCLALDSEKEINDIFKKLSANGGEVIMNLADQFWGAKFGVVKDQFGVTWSLNFDHKMKLK